MAAELPETPATYVEHRFIGIRTRYAVLEDTALKEYLKKLSEMDPDIDLKGNINSKYVLDIDLDYFIFVPNIQNMKL